MPGSKKSSQVCSAVSPIDLSERAMAPDLSRGVMLLLIALAHAPAYLYGRELDPGGYPVDGSFVDRLVTALETILVTGRAYPMFAMLLGYGLVQLHTRQAAGGRDQNVIRRLIRRRGCAMVSIGFVHALLLWAGDIVAAYGLLTVALAGMIFQCSDRTLLSVSALSLLIVGVGSAVSGLPTFDSQESVLISTGVTDPLTAVGARLVEWAPSLVLQPLGLLGAVLLGVWAGRRRMLEEPLRHRRVLRRIGIAGVATAAIGGMPMALISTEVWSNPPAREAVVASSLHYLTGYGGIGYAALLALVSIRSSRPGVLMTAFAACGQRSLTCYLAQSVAFVAILAAYGGGLGNRIGVAASAVLALVVWGVTVGAADLMRQHQSRGPAESLLRRLSYRRADSS